MWHHQMKRHLQLRRAQSDEKSVNWKTTGPQPRRQRGFYHVELHASPPRETEMDQQGFTLSDQALTKTKTAEKDQQPRTRLGAITIPPEQLRDLVTTDRGKKSAIDQLLKGENPIVNWELTRNVTKYRTAAITAKLATAKTGPDNAKDAQDTQPIGALHGQGQSAATAIHMQMRARPNDLSIVENKKWPEKERSGEDCAPSTM